MLETLIKRKSIRSYTGEEILERISKTFIK